MAIVVETPLGDPGVGVHLGGVWFNVAANPADLCAFVYTGPSIAVSTGMRGEFRQNVTTRRLVTTDIRSYETFNLTLEHCDRDQVKWIKFHRVQLLCVRDHYGSKAFVSYLEAPRELSTTPTDDVGNVIEDGDYYVDIKLQLTELDFSEAV